ncbi:unnamed protein product [Prunus armeniaca]
MGALHKVSMWDSMQAVVEAFDLSFGKGEFLRPLGLWQGKNWVSPFLLQHRPCRSARLCRYLGLAWARHLLFGKEGSVVLGLILGFEHEVGLGHGLGAGTSKFWQGLELGQQSFGRVQVFLNITLAVWQGFSAESLESIGWCPLAEEEYTYRSKTGGDWVRLQCSTFGGFETTDCGKCDDVGQTGPTFEQFMYLYSISRQQGNFGCVNIGGTCGVWECPSGKTVTKHVPSHFQFISSVKWGPISKEKEDEVRKVRLLLSETKREYRNLVTPKNLLEFVLLQGSVVKGSMKVVVHIDDAEKQRRLKASRAKKSEREREEEGFGGSHHSVIGTEPKLPTFDLRAPPKLPFGMEEVFAEGMLVVDLGWLRQQKKEVSLAMHRHEMPLVNVFLEGIKSDLEVLARTQTSSFAERAQKTIITSAYAFDEMYVNLAKVDKEI